MEMLYGCPFEKITFLHKIDTNSEFGRAKLISHIRTMIYQYMKIKRKERFQKLVTSPTLASK